MSSKVAGVQAGFQKFSQFSSPAAEDSLWYSSDLLLGAGMVIIQPSTDRVAVIYDTMKKDWFLPKGRKDVGESLEATALREAYEESGLCDLSFLPLHTGTRAPSPSNSTQDTETRLDTEPIFVTTVAFRPQRKNGLDRGGEYISFYYVGQIPHNVVYLANTGMEDEQTYATYLLSFSEAIQRICWTEGCVVAYVELLWRFTKMRQSGEALSMADFFPPEPRPYTEAISASEASQAFQISVDVHRQRSISRSLTRIVRRRKEASVQTAAITRPLSSLSTNTIRDSLWCPSDFLLSAGLVIFQIPTPNVILMYDAKEGCWFLPRGPKLIGEELQSTATREGSEQCGYKVKLLPLYVQSRQPYPPSDHKDGWKRPNTEVLTISTCARQSGKTPRLSGTQHRPDNGVQEITFYYVGYISSNTEPQSTAQLHRQDYTMRLLPIEEAMVNLTSAPRIREESRVLASARQLYTTYAKTERWIAAKNGIKNI